VNQVSVGSFTTAVHTLPSENILVLLQGLESFFHIITEFFLQETLQIIVFLPEYYYQTVMLVAVILFSIYLVICICFSDEKVTAQWFYSDESAYERERC